MPAPGTGQWAARIKQVHRHGTARALSFGGGWFFENGVTGTSGLTIDSITVG